MEPATAIAGGFAVIGIIIVGVSALSWSKQTVRLGLDSEPIETDPWAKTRAILLAAWTLSLPVVLLLIWAFSSPPQQPLQLQWIQLGSKLLGDVWLAVTALLALLIGVKKSSLM